MSFYTCSSDCPRPVPRPRSGASTSATLFCSLASSRPDAAETHRSVAAARGPSPAQPQKSSQRIGCNAWRRERSRAATKPMRAEGQPLPRARTCAYKERPSGLTPRPACTSTRRRQWHTRCRACTLGAASLSIGGRCGRPLLAALLVTRALLSPTCRPDPRRGLGALGPQESTRSRHAMRAAPMLVRLCAKATSYRRGHC